MLKKTNILMNRFVELIEGNHQEITERFMNDLLRDPQTIGYRNLDRQMIYESANSIYRDISTWIGKNYPREEIEKRFRKLGRDRFEQGVPFSHVFRALVLLKRHLWVYVLQKVEEDLEVYVQALDLNNRVVLYFDRASFYMLQGYEELFNKRW
ncbi:MAG TPA: hypothetical protein ENN21_07005 [Spirochaetes bacterium]|nr:hypothetical protein [Spirochaetota bacterium]